MSERQWVNEERTVLVRLWENGQCEVATREHSSHTWGPPVYLREDGWPEPAPAVAAPPPDLSESLE